MKGSEQYEEAKQMSPPFLELSCKGKGDGILLLQVSMLQVAVIFDSNYQWPRKPRRVRMKCLNIAQFAFPNRHYSMTHS